MDDWHEAWYGLDWPTQLAAESRGLMRIAGHAFEDEAINRMSNPIMPSSVPQ
jgi:hypothetical protein